MVPVSNAIEITKTLLLCISKKDVFNKINHPLVFHVSVYPIICHHSELESKKNSINELNNSTKAK